MRGVWRQEWRHFLKAPANVILLAGLLLMTILGAVNGVQYVQQERALVAAAIAADEAGYQRRMDNLQALIDGALEEGRYSNAGYAHGAVLNRGANRPLIPPAAELPVLSSAKVRPTPIMQDIGIMTRHTDQEPSLDDPSNRLDGPFDLVFVATWLLPLFALILGYDVMARDREQGIAGLLATECPLDGVIVRRLLVRLCALMLVVGSTATTAVLLTESSTLSVALPSLIVWLIALCVVTAFWLALAAIVNAVASNTAQASLVLLAAWITIAMLIPAVAGAFVSVVAPAPDHLERVLLMRDIDVDLNRRRAEVSQAYYQQNPQNRPIREGDEFEQYFVTELYPRHLEFDRAFSSAAQVFDTQRVKQARAMRLASVLSPSLALKLLTEDLAGSAPERRIRFLESADIFQSAWRAHFDFKMASMTPLEMSDFETMPTFTPMPESAAARWGRVAWLLALMLVPLLVALLGVKMALRRVSPF